MLLWRYILILCVCVIGFSSKGLAETTLVIATGEYPPYVSKNPKDSFLTEVLYQVGREMGVKFVYKVLPWKRVELAVEKRNAWGAMPYVITPERIKKYYFSEKLVDRRGVFFYYSPSGTHKHIPYTELSDLKGYIIGAVRGYYYEQALLKAGLYVEFVTSEEQSFRKLKAGRVDLVTATEAVGVYVIRNLFPLETGKFFTLSKPLSVSGSHLITSKQYPDTQKLLAEFNKALNKIKANGVYQKILDKHPDVQSY